MSWQEALRRMLPPIAGFEPHTTSPYDAIRDRGTSPHRGVDGNYNVGPNGQRGINLKHPALRSPVDGIVTNAGEGTAGRIAIRDANGFSHELLHTHRRFVSVGDPVVAGQLIGTMGNTGVREPYVESGDHHLHYQLKDSAGRRLKPQAFWEQQGPIDPNPAPPAYVDEYREYLRDARGVPATSRKDVRILTRMPAATPNRSAFDTKPPEVLNVGPASTLPPAAQNQFGGLFGLWPPFSENATSPDLGQTRQGQSDPPDHEDWSAMWRRRTGLP
ncbi:M23 family metallopeptidase [Bradyrhizobium japonicum]|uniref:M23 family metallopeptidase n=1 Tax=Bradyrhizobium japonicum TaxID=375 RepID=UPI0018AD5383|nr:M23 family metallopeptidase [Bradyrhizobium japonicum]